MQDAAQELIPTKKSSNFTHWSPKWRGERQTRRMGERLGGYYLRGVILVS